MTAIDVMRYAQRLSVEVSARNGELHLRGKRAAIDRLAPLVKTHKRELIVELESANQINFKDHLRRFSGLECWGCLHLQMTHERRTDTSRVWFWRCARGYTISEIGVRGQRVV